MQDVRISNKGQHSDFSLTHETSKRGAHISQNVTLQVQTAFNESAQTKLTYGIFYEKILKCMNQYSLENHSIDPAQAELKNIKLHSDTAKSRINTSDKEGSSITTCNAFSSSKRCSILSALSINRFSSRTSSLRHKPPMEDIFSISSSNCN
jgi:hypothetical protein